MIAPRPVCVAGGVLVGLIVVAGVRRRAGARARNDPARQFADYPYAPPMRPHVVDADGHAARAVRLSAAPRGSARAALRRGSSAPMPLRWFSRRPLAVG